VFVEQDDAAGNNHVAVLSTEAWQRYFAETQACWRTSVKGGVTVIGALSRRAYPAEVRGRCLLLDKAQQASGCIRSTFWGVCGRALPG
jgi:hypothetical protein